MKIEDIYLSIARNIANSITNEWSIAVLEIERTDSDAISFSGDYSHNGGKESLNFRSFDRKALKIDSHNLHEITTEGGNNKWNRAKFTLAPSGEFEIDFKWDQALADEIEANS
jgi:hypothetical protein